MLTAIAVAILSATSAAAAPAVPSGLEPEVAQGLERLRAVAIADGEITEVDYGKGGLRVAFALRPTPESFIRCELGLADPSKWDGRFWGLGNGGWAGRVSCTRDGVSAYVCTDLGTSRHQGREADAPREVLTDYAWRATHLMTVEAKRLVEAYYGRKPDRCYFSGASCGGRQGVVEALRFPADYDGILSEVPGFTEHSRASHAWVRDRLKDKYRKWFTKEEIAAVREAELSYFEKVDPWWAHGRFIVDPYPTKAKLDGCWAEIVRRVPALADREEMWRKLFEPVVVNGRQYAPGRLIGIEFDGAWTFLLPKYSGKRRPILNTEEDLVHFAAEPDLAIGHDFSEFKARGGKLIMYGGMEDLSCPEPEMREFYDAVLREMGGIGEVSKFFAYYAVPGRSHRAKGEPFGPGQVGWPTRAERIGKIVDWVEKGVAPGALNFVWAHETDKTLSVSPYPESKLTYSDAGRPETAKWQAAIDAAAAKGGGVVNVPKGRHLVGQLELKNGVELHLEKGAVLEGAVGLQHYRPFSLPFSEGVWSAVIVGDGVTNVAVTGEGTVFGNGAAWPLPTPEDFKRGAQEGLRARGLFFHASKGVRLEGFTLKDAACWGIVFKNCAGVTARRVKIDNHGNFNNDGFDIEARNVLIEDCEADTGDDSFCLKSNDPGFVMENVVIRNCRARGHATSFKIGTATHGVVRNVRFENCTSDVALRSVQYPIRLPDGRVFHYHLSNAFTPRYPNGFNLSAIAIECVDGGCVENVVVDGLEIVDGARAPIFVRADLRKSRGDDGIATPPNSLNVMRNITIANVRGRSMGPVASSITGVKGFRIENVKLKNIDLVQPGAGEERSRLAMDTAVPYLEGRYPSADIFYPHLLPAYGLYVDRACVAFENVKFRLEEGTADLRPAVVVANCNTADDEARIAQSSPDYLVFTPRQRNMSRADPTLRGDSYNDHFQVIWDEKRRLYLAFWTQGTGEGRGDMHFVFSKSADKGATWTYPRVLAGSEFAAAPQPRAVWQQPMLAKSGRLYCLWNQQVTDDVLHHGEMRGMWSDDAGLHWSEPQKVPLALQLRDRKDKPPSWCNWQRPLRLGKDGRFFVGCTRRGTDPQEGHTSMKVEFWEFENIDDDPEPRDIRLGIYAGGKDSLAVEAGNTGRYISEEAGIVRLPDGRLFALLRTRARHPFWSQSRDDGRTWSRLKPLVGSDGKPFLHPCSPCPIYDWKGCEAASGTYFAFIHNAYDDSIEPLGKQPRGPLYLIAGRFDPDGEQPIRFSAPKLFSPVKSGNSYYASYTVADGEGVLWFAHQKHWLLGRKIGPEWFEGN